MRRRNRKLFTAFLIAVFAISAPAVILFTMGYRYNWKKHKLEKTGILRIVSFPVNANILLDGKPSGRVTPYSFTRLLPEDYDIRLEKEGYLPWKKRLSVWSGETTFARTITLFRDALPQIARHERILSSSFSSTGSDLAYLAHSEGWIELRLLTLGQEIPTTLARFGEESYADIALTWSPDDTQLLFVGTHSDDGYTAIAYAADSDGTARVLHDVTPRPAWSMRWAGDGDWIVARTVAGLYAFRAAGTDEPLLLSPFATDAHIKGSEVTLIRGTASASTIERGPIDDVAARQTVLELPLGRHELVDIRDDHAILKDAKNDVYLADLDDGSLTKLGNGMRVLWNPTDPNHALLCGDFELSSLDVPSHDVTLITRVGSLLNACGSAFSGEYALYATGGRIWAIEMDDRDARNLIPLVSFADVTDFTVAKDDRTLWLVGAIGNSAGLYSRPL